MILLDGKWASAQVKEQIQKDVAEFVSKGGKTPHLAAVLVGNDGASETYVASKMKNCEKVGFKSSLFRYDNSVTEAELLLKIAVYKPVEFTLMVSF